MPSLEDRLAVMAKFRDGFADIIQNMVGFLLFRGVLLGGVPAGDQFFDAADIDIAIVEELTELWHVTVKKTAILADGVSAEWRTAGLTVLFKEIKRLGFSLAQGDA